MGVRIGLTPDHFLGWQGGRELFELIAAGLADVVEDDDRLELVVGAGDGGIAWKAAHALKRRLTSRKSGLSHDWHRERLALLTGMETGLPLQNLGNLGHFDVLGPFGSAPRRTLPVPWIGYVADLQHHHLPELFSRAQAASRDRGIARLLAGARGILVNSRSVRDDINAFFPGNNCPIIVMPFAACPQEAWLSPDESIRHRYQVKGPFFLCSNQFWAHKNHGVVFDALARARGCGTPLKCVFTGDTDDFRQPSYFRHLLDEVSRLGIGEDICILGRIPKADQIQLMRLSLAVIQPSLFEGGPGGGAIYNAIAVGSRTIVSDIRVNREISSLVDTFFSPTDSLTLYTAMNSLVMRFGSNKSPKEQDNLVLQEAGLARRRLLGRCVLEAFVAANK